MKIQNNFSGSIKREIERADKSFYAEKYKNTATPAINEITKEIFLRKPIRVTPGFNTSGNSYVDEWLYQDFGLTGASSDNDISTGNGGRVSSITRKDGSTFPEIHGITAILENKGSVTLSATNNIFTDPDKYVVKKETTNVLRLSTEEAAQVKNVWAKPSNGAVILEWYPFISKKLMSVDIGTAGEGANDIQSISIVPFTEITRINNTIVMKYSFRNETENNISITRCGIRDAMYFDNEGKLVTTFDCNTSLKPGEWLHDTYKLQISGPYSNIISKIFFEGNIPYNKLSIFDSDNQEIFSDILEWEEMEGNKIRLLFDIDSSYSNKSLSHAEIRNSVDNSIFMTINFQDGETVASDGYSGKVELEF